MEAYIGCDIITIDIKIVFNYLAKYFDYDVIPKFNELLYKTGSAVTGSTYTQIITREVYNPSDLDVFTTYKKFGLFCDFFRAQGYIANGNYSTAYYDTILVNHTVNCLEFKHPNRKTTVQLVYDNSYPDYLITPHSYVIEFDLTCCMGYFDGIHIYSYFHKETTNKKSLELYKNVKEIKFDCDYYMDLYKKKREKRLNKYQTRQFSITHESKDTLLSRLSITKCYLYPFLDDIREMAYYPGCSCSANCCCEHEHNKPIFRKGGALYNEAKREFNKLKI